MWECCPFPGRVPAPVPHRRRPAPARSAPARTPWSEPPRSPAAEQAGISRLCRHQLSISLFAPGTLIRWQEPCPRHDTCDVTARQEGERKRSRAIRAIEYRLPRVEHPAHHVILIERDSRLENLDHVDGGLRIRTPTLAEEAIRRVHEDVDRRDRKGGGDVLKRRIVTHVQVADGNQ